MKNIFSQGFLVTTFGFGVGKFRVTERLFHSQLFTSQFLVYV